MKKILFSIFILCIAEIVIAQCNPAKPKTYIIKETAPGEIYYPKGNPAWKGGDTLLIPGMNYSGVIEFGNIHGDSCRPITIINKGGIVSTSTIRIKNDCSYIHITGTGTEGVTYGFKISGSPFVFGLAHHVEVDHVEVSDGNIGIFSVVNPDKDDPRTLYPNYLMTDFYIHHNYVHDIHGEGMYIGNSAPNGGNGFTQIPIRMTNVEVAYNIVDRTDWDGIQVSCARAITKIHDNYVSNFGLINMKEQQAGIILGGNSTGDVYSNIVVKGTGNGIEAFGYGKINIYNNLLDSVGSDGTEKGQQSILTNDLKSTVEPNPPQQINIYNNIIRNPWPASAIYIINYNKNSSPASVHDNIFYIKDAKEDWRLTYIIIYPEGSSSSNNINLKQ